MDLAEEHLGNNRGVGEGEIRTVDPYAVDLAEENLG